MPPKMGKKPPARPADVGPDESPFHESTNWLRLYAATALAGALLGVVVALGLLPAIPPQVRSWLQGFESRVVAMVVSMLGGILFAIALTAVAHLGVTLQLRRRSGPRTDKP